MMTEEQVKARIEALEKQRGELQNQIINAQANLNAVEGALIVLREVLEPQPSQPQQSEP